MKINLLENGMDSLKNGFQFFNEFEEKTLNKSPTVEDYLILKHAILSVHHGVEILFKKILIIKNELLVFDKIDENVIQAYKNSLKKGKSILDNDNKAPHTITYQEALNRVCQLLDISISKCLKENLIKLDIIRNSLTHSEINIEDEDIFGVFNNLMSSLDRLFLYGIREGYKTISGYSSLIENYKKSIDFLQKKNMRIKIEALRIFKEIIDDCNLSMGEKDYIFIDNIADIKKIITKINKSNLVLGMDMFDGTCSGNSTVKVCDDSHIEIYSLDNNGKYRFKIKSLYLYLPEIETNNSPILIFESDNDKCEGDDTKLSTGSHNEKYLDGIYFCSDNKEEFDENKLEEFYCNCDFNDEFIIPKHINITRFFTKKIFACFNVQGLAYWDFNQLLYDCQDYDLKKFAIEMRKSLNK